ncbi:MAG: hypothetical protein KDC18_13355 [Alphaproteobacteria bacterium]|nr:hypothetical protein [Alphaproteobacteria bacterium]MCB9929297.1 hypothetical protein [Alphaproteobacteria bacterium]
MSAIGHYLERAGLPTVSISLVRLHTEKMRPPRALWVPYELGRPLGVPNDAAFQTRVLRAALALLERTDGPVLADHAEDAPTRAADDEGDAWVCPVSFPAPAGEETPAAALKREIASLKPWQALAEERRGRTTYGQSGLSIDAAADYVAGFAAGGATDSPLEGVAAAEAFKRITHDLQAFYQEAATAQPGHGGSHVDVLDWFWGQTRAGKLLLACRDRASAGEDKSLKFIADRLLVPQLARARLNL